MENAVEAVVVVVLNKLTWLKCGAYRQEKARRVNRAKSWRIL
jgi:hypothetical protein